MYYALSLFFIAIAITVYTLKSGRRPLWMLVSGILLFLWVTLSAFHIAANYFTGNGITDAVIYTITNSLKGAGTAKYIGPALGLIGLLTLTIVIISKLLRYKKQHGHVVWSLLTCLLLIGANASHPATRQIEALISSHRLASDSDFDDYYKVPQASIPQPKLNLVYIYAESLERTYFDPQAFPDLASELQQQLASSLDFTQTEQLPGTDYTIAGMVASQCGIPLFAPFEGNASSALSSFYPQSLCLGDILKNSGYQNWFIQGADLRFAGKDVFLQSHGFDTEHLLGYQQLLPLVADPSYRNNWGFYDDTVLNQVFETYQRLSKQDQPFALFALTVDTHHPDGFISNNCRRPAYRYQNKINQSFSAVSCSQQHIAELIERIKATPEFKHTIIVVGSDHLAMNNTAWQALNQHPRHDLFMIIRGDQPEAKQITMKRSTLDNGATVLDLLGGDNYLGLGRSSLSATSLSTEFPAFSKKVLAWKPDIIQLWNFPKKITQFTVDTTKRNFSFSGSVFRLPLLLKITPQRVEPIPEGIYATPLKDKLRQFSPDDHFIWVDKCYRAAQVWQPALALSTGWCVVQGTLNRPVQITEITGDKYVGHSQPIDSTIPADEHLFQQVTRALATADNDIRYQADQFHFNLPGAPVGVEKVTGLSRVEEWGRWTNANLAPSLSITYQQPLPARFKLIIRAKAFAKNIGQPIAVTVGQKHYDFTLGENMTDVTLDITQSGRAKTLQITPPFPEESNRDNIIGQAPRRLGIGLQTLQIVPVKE